MVIYNHYVCIPEIFFVNNIFKYNAVHYTEFNSITPPLLGDSKERHLLAGLATCYRKIFCLLSILNLDIFTSSHWNSVAAQEPVYMPAQWHKGERCELKLKLFIHN